jgi:flagellar basal body-associated protein FliL
MNKRVEILVDSIIEDIAEITPFEGQDRFKAKLTDRLEQFEKEDKEEVADIFIGAIVMSKDNI